MRALSKAAENTLISAIEKAAAMVNDGMAPDAAIIKSATDFNIPAGHLDLMVHAYNTGRTTKQREQGENTLEKAADFSLADVTKIRSALYPESVKTSAALVRDSIISTEYAVDPRHMLARHRRDQEKAAAALRPLPAPTYVRPPRDEQIAAQRAYSEKQAQRIAAEEARRVSTAAYGKAASALDSLTTYFRTPGNMGYQDAVREVQLRFGADGVSVLQKVAAVYPHIERQAATKNNYFGDNPLYALVDTVLTATQTYNEVKVKVAAEKTASAKPAPEIIHGSVLDALEEKPLTLKEAAAPRLETLYNDAGREYKATWNDTSKSWDQIGGLKAQQSGGSGGGGGGEKKEKFSPILSPAKFVGGLIGMSGDKDNKAKPSAPQDPLASVKSEFNSLSDPDHESALQGIRAKSVLHDLMLNDPVISGHDPQDVAMAFNEISELSPSLVSSPGMLNAVLRKRLEAGQLGDFDVKQLLEMDKLRAERDKIQNETRRIGLETL